MPGSNKYSSVCLVCVRMASSEPSPPGPPLARLPAEELFLKYDADCSGTIDVTEVEVMLAECGYTPNHERVVELMSMVCDGMDEELDRAQFEKMLRALDQQEGGGLALAEASPPPPPPPPPEEPELLLQARESSADFLLSFDHAGRTGGAMST